MNLAAGPAVCIREMTGYDVEPLAEALGLPKYSIVRRWSECVAGNRRTWVAEVDVALCGLVSIDEHEEVPNHLHLFDLGVAEPLRSRGIGTRLIEWVEEESRARGRAGVYLDVSTGNAGARRLYERLGYAPEGPPFLNSYFRYDEKGNREEVVDTRVRLVKRF